MKTKLMLVASVLALLLCGAAMIAYALLRIAANTHRIAIPILRFTDLVTQCLFERRNIAAIDRPPPVNPGRRDHQTLPGQMAFSYV